MKKQALFIFLSLFVFSNTVFANRDSLWQVWNSKKMPDTTRLNALNNLAWDFLYENPDSCYRIAQILIDHAHKKKIRKWESGGHNIQGISYAVRGDNESALRSFEKCIELKYIEKDRRGVAATLNNVGLLYDGMGNYPKALEKFFESLKIKEELKDSLGLAMGYGNIAIVYDNIKEFDKAFLYYKKGNAINKKLGNKNGYTRIYHDMAINLKERGKIDSSLLVFEECMNLFEEEGIDRTQLYMNIGVIYSLKGEFGKAESYLKNAIQGSIKNENKTDQAAAYGHLGKLYYDLNDYNQALLNSHKGFDVANEIGAYRQVLDNANWLYLVYKKQGNNAKALYYYEAFIKAKDTLFNEEKTKDMARYEVRFETDKKAAEDSITHAKEKEIKNAEISRKNAELDQQDTEIKAKRNQQFFLFGGLGLVLIFAGFMYNRFKVTQRQKNVIEEQKNKVEEQNVLIQHQKHEVEEKNKEITDSINYAKRIQEAILPSRYSLVENLKNGFVLYKPKDIVAGDFYWLEKVGNKIYFAAADCTGHGVPGAMVSVVCSNALSKALLEEGITEPGKILDRTRELVIEKFSKSGSDVKDGMDISLCVLNMENDSDNLQWSGANNPLWIIRKDAVELEELKADKQPIGKYGEPKPFTTHRINLKAGDSFYIFTDGYADQFGGVVEGSGAGKKFKAATFKKLLLSIQDKSMDEQKELINSTFENWRGELEQVDDVCVIGVRF